MIRATAAVLIAVAAIGASLAGEAHGHSWMGDFRAFSCAAHVRLSGADPYAAAPIAACESEPAPSPFFVMLRGVALPAPLPGYLIAAFVPFALLPFVPSALLWGLILVAAFIGTILLLRDLGVGDGWTLLVAFSIPVLAISLPVGELPPVALFGIVLAAWAAARERPGFLALGVALAMYEPQIGLAVAIAAAALSRRFAYAAGIALGTLLLLSLLTLGIAANVAYVRDIIPAHELSELPAVVQYSLSWVLDRVGVADASALLLGRVSWMVMLVTAFFVARSAFGREHREFAILAAPALAVVGGPFLHLDHVAVALPAALWLCARHEAPWRWALAGAICLALPLLTVFEMTPVFGGVVRYAAVIVPLVAGWVATAYTRRSIVGLRVAALALVLTLLIGLALEKTGVGAVTLSHVHGVSSRLAQATWSAYVRSHFIFTAWTIWLVKVPTWFGILATALSSLAVTARGYKSREHLSGNGTAK